MRAEALQKKVFFLRQYIQGFYGIKIPVAVLSSVFVEGVNCYLLLILSDKIKGCVHYDAPQPGFGADGRRAEL